MIDVLQFCFRDFWTWLGLTIWLLILSNYLQKNIYPRIRIRYNKFRELFRRNFRKELVSSTFQKKEGEKK